MKIITNRTENTTLAAVLLPALANATGVTIAAGYAGKAGSELLNLPLLCMRIPVRIIVGRAIVEGMNAQNWAHFQALNSNASMLGGGVKGAGQPFHAKIYYIESHGGAVAWIGSSNLTSHGLAEWSEANLRIDDPALLLEISSLLDQFWDQGRPSEEIPIVSRQPEENDEHRAMAVSSPPVDETKKTVEEILQRPRVCLSFLRNGEVPQRSGLNWWNGAGRERNANEAYIPVRSQDIPGIEEVLGSAAPNTRFIAITPDGTEMELQLEGRTAEGYAKQIASLGEKSILGKWLLRTVLKQKEWTLVTREVLMAHGKTEICLARAGEKRGLRLVNLEF